MGKGSRMWISLSAAILLASCNLVLAETVRVATFNVQNYLDVPVERRKAKPADAKAKVCEHILALKPDVLAMQEMGTTNALLQLQSCLKEGGLDLPHWEHVTGQDTNVHIAVLSRFPFGVRHQHTNINFLLSGRRLRVSRGFSELEIKVGAKNSFTLLAAHLKSRLAAYQADEAEWREREAVELRKIIDEHFAADPNSRLVVLGDFNDLRSSRPIKALIGKGKVALFDTRPTEQGNGGGTLAKSRGKTTKPVAWTHYYDDDDTYSRVDYILVSPAMKRLLVPEKTFVLTMPDWGADSDHRPIVATFSMP